MTAETKSTSGSDKNNLTVTSKSGQTEVTVKVGNPPSGHKSGLQKSVDNDLDTIEKKLKGK